LDWDAGCVCCRPVNQTARPAGPCIVRYLGTKTVQLTISETAPVRTIPSTDIPLAYLAATHHLAARDPAVARSRDGPS
jgi:hypothetical protein